MSATTEAPTGWTGGLMQDISRELTRWFLRHGCPRALAAEAARAIRERRAAMQEGK